MTVSICHSVVAGVRDGELWNPHDRNPLWGLHEYFDNQDKAEKVGWKHHLMAEVAGSLKFSTL